jgi:hypothetical protein
MPDLLDSSKTSSAWWMSVQCSRSVQVIWQGAQETDARYSYLQHKARRILFRLFASTYPRARLQSRRRRPPCLSHPLSLPLCLHCTALHTAPSLAIFQPRLILPYLLALPCHADACLPACLSHLLACLLLVQPSQPLEVGSRKVLKYQNAWTGERSPRCRVHVYLRYRSVWGVAICGSLWAG